MHDPAQIIEQREAVQHLQSRGFARLLEALGDPECYTRAGQGRLVVAKLARLLNLDPKSATSLLDQARAALQ